MRAVLDEPAYRGRFAFEVYPWEHERSAAARDTYAFGFEKHGMVVLLTDGTLSGLRPGHDYGATEIRVELDRVLAR